jgi:hypothetical protein
MGQSMITTVAERAEERLTVIFDALLIQIGDMGAKKMQSHLSGRGIDTGRLFQSIAWATPRARDNRTNGSVLKEGDLPVAPTERFSVNIGTGCPYAPQVNYGSLPMGRGGSGSVDPESGTFQEKIKEWAERHGVDTSTPEGRSHLFFIMKRIKDKGTDAIEFFENSLVDIRREARLIIDLGMQKFMGAGFKPEVIIVDAQHISKVNTRQEGK